MRKGIVIFSVVNFLLAAVMALLGLSYGQPVQSCYLMYSLSLAGGSLVLFGLNKRIHKTSIISSYIAALLSALWAMLSLVELLGFSNDWLLDLLSLMFFLVVTIYLIGYRGYLLEITREQQESAPD